MAVDITALYYCLDDFCELFEAWQAHRLIPSQRTRQRPGKLLRSEMLFIVGVRRLMEINYVTPNWRRDQLAFPDHPVDCSCVTAPNGAAAS